MKLTHISSLTRAAPQRHPVSRDSWPESTVVGPEDVSIAGFSLLRLVDWCDTPCVHTAAAIVPGTDGQPSETELASVIVTRVQAIEHRGDGDIDAWVDAELAGCVAIPTESRIIGRPSTDDTRRVNLRPTSSDFVIHSELPADLRIGDLIVIPCRGATSLQDVRPGSHRHGRVPDAGANAEPENAPLPRCGR